MLGSTPLIHCKPSWPVAELNKAKNLSYLYVYDGWNIKNRLKFLIFSVLILQVVTYSSSLPLPCGFMILNQSDRQNFLFNYHQLY